jgi:hypothetical protein
MLKKTLGAAIFAAAALSVSNFANATPVFTTSGDPFPAGSTITLTPGSAFNTPYGWVHTLSISAFDSTPGITQSGGNITYTYDTATFSNQFWDASSGGTAVGSFTGTTTNFQAVVNGRGGLFDPGTYAAQLLDATFVGSVTQYGVGVIGVMTTRIDPSVSTTGSVTYGTPGIVGGHFGQTADSSFAVQGQYDPGNTGTFNNVPLTGDSTPPDVVGLPVPAPLALMVPGLLAMFAGRRRAAVAA